MLSGEIVLRNNHYYCNHFVACNFLVIYYCHFDAHSSVVVYYCHLYVYSFLVVFYGHYGAYRCQWCVMVNMICGICIYICCVAAAMV